MDEIVKSAMARFQAAERDKQVHKSKIEDCYRYCMPWRHLENNTQPSPQRIDDIFDGIGMVVLEDFASDMLATFTPGGSQWVEFMPSRALDTGEQRQIQEAMGQYATVLFSEMARSSLYQALQEAYNDLGPGTMALVINDPGPSEPLHCEAIPIPELWIDRGPRGDVDGKFRKKLVRGRHIKTLWPDAKVNVVGGLQVRGQDEVEFTVYEHLTRNWSVPGTEIWDYLVTVGGDVIVKREYRGEGSCPIIVARWSRDSTTAWGVGPTYRSVPDIKVLQYVAEKGLAHLDKIIDPVTSYVDDGVTNVSAGLEPGSWLARALGSDAPEVIESSQNFDLAEYKIDEIRQRVRRNHFQDRPEQLGKTPPTATQWMDEAAEKARRMGTPATNLVQELQYPIIKRFAYLLARRGVLPEVRLNDDVIQLMPVSPLMRAQAQEEVMRIDRWAEQVQLRLGPEQAALVINGPAMAKRTAELMGVPVGLFRSKEEIQKIMAAAQQAAPAEGA